MSAQEEQIPIQDETVQDTNVDAGAEDEVVASGSEEKQLQSEASELDTSNIIDDSPGVSTRGAKIDATKQVSFATLPCLSRFSRTFTDTGLVCSCDLPQEREIDQAVDAAEKADESTQ